MKINTMIEDKNHMMILIVDDDARFQIVIKAFLQWAGYNNLVIAKSAREALELLHEKDQNATEMQVDVILMDVNMPGMNGIEATKLINENERLRDIPIIMVTASGEEETLAGAFEAGAVDYIMKPINKIELRARVRSVLKLKQETDRRKTREQELFESNSLLQEANQKLERLSFQDGLTGISNRRYFDKFLEKEWFRAMRQGKPVALIMMDIDFFKLYNDSYGHQSGDGCLKMVAKALSDTLKRPAELVARYGGEEFVALLPDIDEGSAVNIAELMCSHVASLGIVHEFSQCSDVVTVSGGLAIMVPQRNTTPQLLVEAADKALYRAKHEGRNRFCLYNGKK